MERASNEQLLKAKEHTKGAGILVASCNVYNIIDELLAYRTNYGNLTEVAELAERRTSNMELPVSRIGVIRRIDDLGRVVIPKEVRERLKIKGGDPLEIIPYNGAVVLFKYIEQEHESEGV